MTYRAVDCHNMMGEVGFRVEQLKFWTFVFQFLALVGSFKTLLYYYANHLAHPFQPGPGEGPRKGLLCDCEKSNFLKVHFQLYWSLALVIFVPQCQQQDGSIQFLSAVQMETVGSVVPVCDVRWSQSSILHGPQ